ncbi:MAG: hypothetical protein ACRC1R_10395 [Cetobacterium sp.]|uniref:hypothetical protein n=1 Tax=Cetobacterium sp. TaxID=2071632 RepID=UPI003F314918
MKRERVERELFLKFGNSMTLAEICEIFNYRERTILKAIQNQELKCIGGRYKTSYRIDMDSILEKIFGK